jgi:hypothetical protein
MKASFTSRDYARILELAHLGLWVAGARPDEPGSAPERYAGVAQKLFGLATAFGCADLVVEAEAGGWRATEKLAEGPAREKLDQFLDDTFWTELVQRLAERDLRVELGATKLDDELSPEEETRLTALEDGYWREFEQRGVDHLLVLRGGRG